MAQSRKVIITCAVTGSIHTPSMSPYLPVSAQQIADAAVGAAEAGAAIVHLHARKPGDGQPDQSPDAFRAFVGDIKARSNVVVNITTGGSPAMTVDERMQPALQLKPEVASLNMGSMNFGLYPMLARYKDLKHEWESTFLASTRDLVFKNTFADIEYILTQVPPTAPGSSSSATTPRTCTRWPTSWIASSPRRRSLCKRCSASWAASAPIPMMYRT